MDDIPSAAYLNPPLTTIAQDFDRMAVDALRKLVVQIEDPTAPDIPPDQADAIQLIVRNSTAPIAAGSSSIGARRQMTISHP
jgi:DNA-binding LacI/PurR family transcriptional regulator